MSESEQAHAAATALPGGRVVVLPSGPDQQPIEVPASVVKVLADVLDHVQRGEHVRVIADDEEITTQQAAALINVSRPYLVGLDHRVAPRPTGSVRAGRRPGPKGGRPPAVEVGRRAPQPGGRPGQAPPGRGR